MQQTTLPGEWRLQATDNKQGSSGFLEEWTPELCTGDTRYGIPQIDSEDWPRFVSRYPTPGDYLAKQEEWCTSVAKTAYAERLRFGIAKEQARKDLPLSTYTRAYWKCDLHNIFNFLRLRMDSHAQLEIRSYAIQLYEIVKSICPVACEAFEDYVLHAKKFSRMEMEFLTSLTAGTSVPMHHWVKPDSMTDREWKEFLAKLS
jgi:thymidylate synthase (FAD)